MTEIWAMITLVAIGSYAARGFFFLRRTRSAQQTSEPPPLWLEMVPSAAFAALVVPALLAPGGNLDVLSAELLSACLAALVAWRTRSIAATILLGLGAYLLLGQLGWPG